MQVRNTLIIGSLLGVFAVSAHAAVVKVSGDTTLEGGWGLMDAESPYVMQALPPTGQTPFTTIDTWEASFGEMNSEDAHEVRLIGDGWFSWSHGYTGEVFFHSVVGSTYLMPENTTAFDFYLQPGDFGTYEITVSAQDSSGAADAITKQVEGMAGAAHFGFYVTEGETLVSVTVHAISGAGGYAWAEGRLGTAPCSGDVTGDSEVGFADLLALLAAWGPCDSCDEDLDQSGSVDFNDLLELLASWGPCF